MTRAALILFCLLSNLWSPLCWSLYGGSSDVIDVAAIPHALEADPYIKYLEDPAGLLIIDDFLHGDSKTALQPTPGGVLNRGYSEAAIWIRLELKLATPCLSRNAPWTTTVTCFRCR